MRAIQIITITYYSIIATCLLAYLVILNIKQRIAVSSMLTVDIQRNCGQ